MPGNGPCKFKGCNTESRGSRCRGYCWKHFKLRFPKEGQAYHKKVLTSAKGCHNCGPKALAQETDPVTGLRYCRRCMSMRRSPSQPHACSLCTSKEKEMISIQCSSKTCAHLAWLCPPCDGAYRAAALCSVCMARRPHGCCFLCEAALPRPDKGIRICRACENEAHARWRKTCYMCRSCLTEPSERPACQCCFCAASPAPLLSQMCALCYNLVGEWLSTACYRRQAVVKESHRKCRCIACGTAWARSACGRLCLRCAAERARADRDRTLVEEAVRHVAGSAHDTCPSELPPAMDLLRWPRAAPDLRPYQPQADWLPTCHCRLCFCRISDHQGPEHLEQHLAEIHGIDLREYRRRILQDAMTGMRPTTPQLLRNRLAAYREKAVGPNITPVCG